MAIANGTIEKVICNNFYDCHFILTQHMFI